MKKLLVTLFLFISFLGFGQQVNAPDPKEFIVNTSGQDASGFSLSGFNSTATLLCAIGLPTAPTGTTFYFSTTSGVTASTGYTMSGNKTRISFTGTQANINNGSTFQSSNVFTGLAAGTYTIVVSDNNSCSGSFASGVSASVTLTQPNAISVTAVAQAELEDRERPGAYHSINFARTDGSGNVTIATTRPELIPACVALVAHPDDPRYQPLFGKTVRTPLFDVEVPVVAHELAQIDKGTGIAMICTFGDLTDVIWWRELNLKRFTGLKSTIFKRKYCEVSLRHIWQQLRKMKA